MAATMNYYSTALLAEKSYCRSCTYSIKIYTNVFARTFYKQMVAFIQSRNLKIYKKLLKLVTSVKAVFLFSGLNLNRIIQKKKYQKRHIL